MKVIMGETTSATCADWKIDRKVICKQKQGMVDQQLNEKATCSILWSIIYKPRNWPKQWTRATEQNTNLKQTANTQHELHQI
jgi:hypothetical protein